MSNKIKNIIASTLITGGLIMSYALQFTPTNKNNDIKTAVATSSYYDVN
jgi:hypothetical protein